MENKELTEYHYQQLRIYYTSGDVSSITPSLEIIIKQTTPEEYESITGETINNYITTVTGEPKRGEREEGDFTAFVNKSDLGEHTVDLPDTLLNKMGWNAGDILSLSITENLFDFGEVDSIVLRNLTKEKE